MLLITLSGCWDSVELEDRALIMGVGVDRSQEGKLLITYQVALPAQIVGQEGQGGGGGEATLNLLVEGESIFSANSSLCTKIDLVPDFQHLQVFVIGEEAARQGVGEFLDYFMRNYQMRRRTKVFVTPGTAHELLETNVRTQKSSALYMARLSTSNQKSTARMTTKMDLGGLIANTRGGSDFLMGCAQAEKEDIEISCAGVFKKGRLVGYLDEDSLLGAQWLKGGVIYTELVLDNPTDQITRAVCNMNNVHVKTTPIINNNKINFKVKITTEGDLMEIKNVNTIVYTEEEIKRIEQALEQKIIQICRESLNLLQKEYGADGLDWDWEVRDKHYSFWQVNKDRWDELFSAAQMDLEVEAKIRRTGLTR